MTHELSSKEEARAVETVDKHGGQAVPHGPCDPLTDTMSFQGQALTFVNLHHLALRAQRSYGSDVADGVISNAASLLVPLLHAWQ